MTRNDIFLAATPPALWGFAYAIAKPTTGSFPPLFLAAICYAVTALALFRPWRGLKSPVWLVVTAATLGASIQSALIFYGISIVPASAATLVVQTQVPFAVLAAWAIGQETLNLRRSLGIVIAIAGVAFLVGLPQSAGSIAGLVSIIAGTASWGVAQGLVRAHGKDPGGPFMGAMSAVASPQLLILSVLLESGQIDALGSASLLAWGGVLTLAGGGFVLAYSIWYSMMRRHRVDTIAPFILLMPVFGLLTAFLFLGERPSPALLIGGAVILAGLTLVVRAKDKVAL